VNANYSCSDPDGASDVKTCQGTVANGKPINTTTTGSHSFTVHASDKAGNTSTKTVHYTVDQTGPRPGGWCDTDQDRSPTGECVKQDNDDDD
jgi:hypothetical protein